MNIQHLIEEYIQGASDKAQAIRELKALLFNLSPHHHHPVDNVQWVPIESVRPNDYNPNSVASIEMRLLYVSISHDGYTQPVVVIREDDHYVIVDGFHRYYVAKNNKDIYESTHGLLPVVVLDKDVNDRMASTVRHNRARGKHSVQGMSNIVFTMLENGWQDSAICNELGLEPEELLRLKHITGFSKLFSNQEYNKAWKSRRQILLEKEYQDKQKKDSK